MSRDRLDCVPRRRQSTKSAMLPAAQRPAPVAAVGAVTFVERPAPTGDRWIAALAILLEAGHEPDEVEPA